MMNLCSLYKQRLAFLALGFGLISQYVFQNNPQSGFLIFMFEIGVNSQLMFWFCFALLGLCVYFSISVEKSLKKISEVCSHYKRRF